MPDDRCMDDPGNGRRRTGAFHLRLGETPGLDQIGEPAHEFAHANRDAVKVRDALQKYRSCEHAAQENEPHQGTALLHVVDHGEGLYGASGAGGKSRGTIQFPACVNRMRYFPPRKTSHLGILTAVDGEEFFFDQTVTMPI